MAADQQPTLGLSLAYFHQLIDMNGGQECFQDLSTLDVCMRFVKPMTESSKVSLVDHVRSQPGGDEFAKPAQWLISHSWSYKFLDVVDAIDNFCQEQALGRDTSFWFCMFANNQHIVSIEGDLFDHWLQAFRSALEDTKKMVMVLSPWHDPETLKRTWCVYEVYLSIVLNARFEIAMGKTQKAAFLDDIQNVDSIIRMRAQVNCKNSITTVPSDRHHIFHLIEENVGGTVQLDRMVLGVMLTWVLHTVNQQLDLACGAEDRFRWLFTKAGILSHAGSYDQAIQAYQAAIDLFQTELPKTFWQGWEAVCLCIELRAKSHESPELWEPMLNEAIPMLQDLLGREHPVTLSALRLGGASLIEIRRYDRAKTLLDECYEHEKQKPHDFSVKYTTMHHLGDWHLVQNSLADAAEWYNLAYQGYARLYGPSHDRCMASLSNLAMCCSRQGRYLEAEASLNVVADEAQRALGPTHRETVRRRANLASIKRMRGENYVADEILRHCIHHLQSVSDDHGVAICFRHRGLIKWDERDYTQAKALVELFTASGVASVGPKSYFGWVGLLNSYMIRLEMDREFDSMDKIDHFVAQLEAADLCHETWNEVLCHGCYKLVQGDLTMCAQCPRLAVLFCPTCVETKPNTVCDHLDGPWIVVKPPMRFLLEQKLTLLATQKTNDWQGLYDATAAAYVAYCNHFNVMDRFQVKSQKRDHLSHASVRWGMVAAVAAVAWLNHWLKI